MGIFDNLVVGSAEQRARNEAASNAVKERASAPVSNVRDTLLKLGYKGPGADKLRAGAQAAAEAAANPAGAGQAAVGAQEALSVVGQIQDSELRRSVLAEANRMAIQQQADAAAANVDNALAQSLLANSRSEAQVADVLSSAFAKVSVERKIAEGAIKSTEEAEQMAGGLRNAFAEAAAALRAAPK